MSVAPSQARPGSATAIGKPSKSKLSAAFEGLPDSDQFENPWNRQPSSRVHWSVEKSSDKTHK